MLRLNRIVAHCLLAAAPPIAVAADASLDFSQLVKQVEAFDGTGFTQYHRDWGADTQMVPGLYANLEGFADDTKSFKRVIDTAWGTRLDNGELNPTGMGLHSAWAEWSMWHAKSGSLGETYADCDWSKTDWSMYEPGTTLSDTGASGPYDFDDGYFKANAAKAHTTQIFHAILKRARTENTRVMLYMDNAVTAHYLEPGSAKRIDAENRNESALFLAMGARYFASRHGIPLFALRIINEPTSRGRVSVDQATFIPVLREKLAEVGLPGVRIIASPTNTSGIFDSAVLPYYDYHSHHYFDNKGPYDNDGKVLDWGGSYRPQGYFSNADNFRMGPKENIDDYVQLKSWLLLQGAAMGMNTWQLVNRLGIHERRGPFASTYEPHKIYGSNAETSMDDGDLRMVDSGAIITPFLRPGMFFVDGSQGNDPGDGSDSVEGFTGRGHAPVILITNDGGERSFTIDLRNCPTTTFTRYQAHATSARQQLADVTVSGGRITVSVPAHSITTLVGQGSVSHAPRAYVVVGDAGNRTTRDDALLDALGDAGFDVVAVSQTLTSAQQNVTNSKRHPVDLTGAACYIIAESVTNPAVAMAHDMSMAPVLCLADDLRDELGLDSGRTVLAGGQLNLRRSVDPPASMLDGGVPRSCGYRRHLPGASAVAVAAAAIDSLVHGGAVTMGAVTPQPYVVLHGTPVTGVAPVTVSFDASDNGNWAESVTGYDWDFGDGTTLRTSVPTTTHVYASAGDFVATVTVRAGADETATDRFTITSTAPVVQMPFPTPSSPHPVPGRIEIENFDSGGQGTAYHDTGSGNQGDSTYRAGEHVDLVETSDENGGANLGYTEVGEWLEYTVTIIGGEYELDLRHASGGTGGSFRLDCDGDDVSGVIDLAGTGGWQTWETHTAPGITLPAGEHVLRLTVLSSGSNLNWLALREVGSDAVRTIIMDHVDGYMWSSIPGSTSVEGPSTSTFADLDPTADHLLTPVPASNN